MNKVDRYDISGIILAGGMGKRIGYKNKALLKINDRTIIEHIIDALSEVTDNLLLVTNLPDEFEHLGIAMFGDIIPKSGPIGGIYSGLSNSQTHYNLIIACDMPFVQPCLFRFLIDNIDGNDIVIPVTPDGYHPLCAIYSKSCIEPIEHLIALDELKVTSLFDYVRVKKIKFPDSDPECDLRVFFNINTYEDYVKAVSLLVDSTLSKHSQ